MAEYINREAVLNHLNECKEDPLFDPDMARICFAMSVFIENMQAADVQPVRHGRWNIKENHFHSNIIMNYAECSCCGHTCSTTESEHNNYCPKCGADMRGDPDV